MICPGISNCYGAHDCSWLAAMHALPKDPMISITEIVREKPWGFFEWDNRRTYSVNESITHPSRVWNGSTESTDVSFFHILTGEGTSRTKLESSVRNAVRGGANEIWVMEHNVQAHSWSNRNAWPRGRPVHVPREKTARCFSLRSWCRACLSGPPPALIKRCWRIRASYRPIMTIKDATCSLE